MSGLKTAENPQLSSVGTAGVIQCACTYADGGRLAAVNRPDFSGDSVA